jgi:hypothetical protein
MDSVSDKGVERRPPKDGYGGWNFGGGGLQKQPAEGALGLYQVQFLSPGHCLSTALYAELAIGVIDV